MHHWAWTFAMISSVLFGALGSAAQAKPAKVVVIGVDGVSLNLLEPYAKAGVTPNMKRMLEEGARGDLASIWPLRTPQVWTTAVTGKYPGQHGIWDHLSNTYFNPPPFRSKEKIRVTTKDRRSKALWNILSEKNISTASVGWMATWPAEDVASTVLVSPIELKGDKRQTTIKGSFYRDAPNMVMPKSYESSVRKLIVEASDLSAEDMTPFASMPPESSALYKLPYLRRYVYGLKWSLARARSVENITRSIAAKAQPDVLFTYFQCTDSMLHRFWIFQMGEERIRARLKGHKLDASHAAELSKRFGKVVEACYRDVDARIGRILAEVAGPDTLVLLISDHGFGDAPEPHRMRDEPYSGNHLDDGIILAMGPGIPAGKLLKKVSILDITPSILHHLGLPVASDMPGKVVGGIIGASSKRALELIGSYERKPQHEIPYQKGYPPKGSTRRSDFE
jgi:predicted AlkP superfamily phosphohydrolase/phosphomutase